MNWYRFTELSFLALLGTFLGVLLTLDGAEVGSIVLIVIMTLAVFGLSFLDIDKEGK